MANLTDTTLSALDPNSLSSSSSTINTSGTSGTLNNTGSKGALQTLPAGNLSYGTINTGPIPVPLYNLNPNYLVQIVGNDESGNPIGASAALGIIAPMPEDFSLHVYSHWQSLLGDMINQKLGSILPRAVAATRGALNDLAELGGISTQLASFTQLLWTATDPISFNIPLRFNAVRDSQAEVMQPVFQLLELNLPSVDGILLKAPGPSFNPNSKYKVNIHIGRALSFLNVIITGVSTVFNTLSDNKGNWLSCDVDLSISTSRILTKSDFANTFKNVPTPDAPSPFSATSGNISVGNTQT